MMTAQTGHRVVGYIESVVIDPGNIQLKAKIDTGAKSSSIHSINILPFVKDGKPWVRFTVVDDDNRRRRFRLPVLRVTSIKRAGAPPQRRFVVEMGICLGDLYKKAEVNLVNRDKMQYRMLIGRLYTAGDFIVDPNAVDLTKPVCPAG